MEIRIGIEKEKDREGIILRLLEAVNIFSTEGKSGKIFFFFDPDKIEPHVAKMVCFKIKKRMGEKFILFPVYVFEKPEVREFISVSW